MHEGGGRAIVLLRHWTETIPKDDDKLSLLHRIMFLIWIERYPIKGHRADKKRFRRASFSLLNDVLSSKIDGGSNAT